MYRENKVCYNGCSIKHHSAFPSTVLSGSDLPL